MHFFSKFTDLSMNDPTEGKSQKFNQYLKYSGIAFQMAGVVLLGLFAGRWLDGIFSMSKPVFTMLLILLFFGGFMFKLYKELNKDN
jgi:ATP synthase protein I